MATRIMRDDLVDMVRMALRSADDQSEWGAAAYLNQALVILTGDGANPLLEMEPAGLDQ